MTEAEKQALVAENAALRQANQALQKRIAALEQRLAKDSQTSHKPPSSDGLAKKTRSLRQPSGKRPRGQHGHEGRTRPLVATPDDFVALSPTTCPQCQTALSDVPAHGHERRQVIDLAPIRAREIEYQAQQVTCPGCRRTVQATFPSGVTGPVQYGPQIRALAVYLLYQQYVPFQRTTQILAEVCGCPMSVGTVQAWTQQAAQTVAAPEQQIRQALRTSPVSGPDETPRRVQGRWWWEHVSRTEQFTHVALHTKRGKAALEAIGILPGYTGVSVHDGWQSYRHYTDCQHALCHAHHLHELAYFVQVEHQPWAEALMAHLRVCHHQVEQARQQGANILPREQCEALLARYHALVKDGQAAQPPPTHSAKGRPKQTPARNLLERLLDQAATRFLTDFRVPFTNNGAERDLRCEKIQAKISGSFRSVAGALGSCRIRTYLGTLHKQGIPALMALRSVFVGSPLSPLPAE